MTLKFTENYGGYKKGDVVSFIGTRGHLFLRRGVAKEYVPRKKTKEEKFTKKTK